MIESGKIIEINKERCIIELDSKGGCANCGINNYCHTSGTAKRNLNLKLEGRKFEEGDLIEIETPAHSLLTAAFLVFILPLILSTIAYSIIYSLTNRTGWAIISFFGIFVLSEFLIAWIDRIWGKGRFFEPRIIQKLN
jgi:positive regulator of sigma E activity